MHVKSKRSFNLLKLLRLDQSKFGPARILISLNEKLAQLCQDLIFLRRCRQHGIFPHCIQRSVRLQFSMRSSPSLQRFMENTRRVLLTRLIRDKHAGIFQKKQQIQELREKLPENLVSHLQTVVETAVKETKSASKSRLIKKFEKLEQHKFRPARSSSDLNASLEERVSVLDGTNLSKPTISILAKGPNFVATPDKISRDKLQHIVQVETAALAYHLRWQSAMSSSTTKPAVTDDLNKACPFHHNRKEPPRTNMQTEKAIQGLRTDLQRLVEKPNLQLTPNVTKAQKNTLQELRENKETTVTRSDKGGEIVVMKNSSIENLCFEHLNDSATYKRLTKNTTNTIRLKVNKSLSRILSDRDFPKHTINRLKTPSTARTQRFYALPKTHKAVLKIRPIVSACGGIFDRLGWFLQYLLKPLLKSVPAHLNNTAELVSKIHAIDTEELKGLVPVSFDVVSLYTNVNTNEAIDTALEHCRRSRIYLYGLRLEDIWELLHLLLDNNVFEYEGLFYQQIRGLAMGNRLSGTLAIICMDRLERKFVYSLKPKPIFYVRYVDDVGTLVPDEESAVKMLNYLNSKHPTIQFEMELPDTEGFLPILDIKMKIGVDGGVERKLFCKAANKGLTLNYNSHHPRSTKNAIARNEIQRAIRCSTKEHEQSAIAVVRSKLSKNDYPESALKPPKPKKNKSPRSLIKSPLYFQYLLCRTNLTMVCNVFLISTRLMRVCVTLVAELSSRPLPGRAHPRPFTKPCKSGKCGAPEICHRSNVVYQAMCTLCGSSYIGMTTRALHARALEHIAGARKHSLQSAFGEHYKTKHPKMAPSLNFRILQQCRDELRLHIEEALAIQRHRPQLNRRDEDMGTGFLI